jgi:hypothetical protein
MPCAPPGLSLRYPCDEFEFYVARTRRSHPRVVYDDENGLLDKTKIGSLFPLPAKRSLYYLFDYGDSWVFKLNKSRLPASDPKPRALYPRLINSEGRRPKQYPAQ